MNNRLMAQEAEDTTSNEQSYEYTAHAAAASKYLTFRIADTEYGVNVPRVRQVTGWNSAKPADHPSTDVIGLLNLRGTAVPVVDLRQCFELESSTCGPTTAVVVVQIANDGRRFTVSFVVDSVCEVVSTDSAEIELPHDLRNDSSASWVQGYAVLDGNAVTLLDIDEIPSLRVFDGAVADKPLTDSSDRSVEGKLT